jgi:hypothetical protein
LDCSGLRSYYLEKYMTLIKIFKKFLLNKLKNI